MKLKANRTTRKKEKRKKQSPIRMRRLSGLVEHFMRRRSSVMRSTEETSSKLTDEGVAIFDVPNFLSLECDFVER